MRRRAVPQVLDIDLRGDLLLPRSARETRTRPRDAADPPAADDLDEDLVSERAERGAGDGAPANQEVPAHRIETRPTTLAARTVRGAGRRATKPAEQAPIAHSSATDVPAAAAGRPLAILRPEPLDDSGGCCRSASITARLHRARPASRITAVERPFSFRRRMTRTAGFRSASRSPRPGRSGLSSSTTMSSYRPGSRRRAPKRAWRPAPRGCATHSTSESPARA